MVKIAIIIICSLSVIMFLFSILFNSASQFFKEADEIELLIKSNGPNIEIRDRLSKLNAESFNQDTHSRVRELCKMYELNFKEKCVI